MLKPKPQTAVIFTILPPSRRAQEWGRSTTEIPALGLLIDPIPHKTEDIPARDESQELEIRRPRSKGLPSILTSDGMDVYHPR